ncbi:transglutaminase-like domain-containing protein [Oryzobacter sp. R7]|uniref:transglutaminase-like domain-containing protein n=1 Tax=Oryzobacter faecalis TaxID=3388656 RepID=UPI00398CD8F2
MSPERSTTIHVALDLPVETAGRLAVSVAVAGHLERTESLTVATEDGAPVPHHEVEFDCGTVLHVIDAPSGHVRVRYGATVALGVTEPRPVTEADALRYVIPSRYCPSDRVEGYATAEFGHLEDDTARALGVAEWAHLRLTYSPGSTTASDDALVPLHSGHGVCRDYAHLVVTMLRALGMPARYVSVYAPGLSPMDAHAVAEVAVDGTWRLVDATRLAPRGSMVRIGTGRDAADVAIVTGLGGTSAAPGFTVTATAEPHLPEDDPDQLVTLA